MKPPLHSASEQTERFNGRPDHDSGSAKLYRLSRKGLGKHVIFDHFVVQAFPADSK